MKALVISDVDGCLTDGKYIYTADGKVAKVFGPHDNDGVKMLRAKDVDIVFISADKRGFPITKKRIDDMKCPIFNVSEAERVEWVKKYIKDGEYNFTVFFGDGIGDVPVKEYVNLFITPLNGREEAKRVAQYITPSEGGHGAFLDLALYVINQLNIIDLKILLDTDSIFIAAHLDFEYNLPYKGTIITKNPLKNEYNVPTFYATGTDLDAFKNSLAELYQTYWLYTKYQDHLGDYVCFNQYRRYLIDITHKITCCKPYRMNIDEQYAICHKYEDFKLCELIIKDKFPKYYEGLKYARNANILIAHNIYVLPKLWFNEFCEFKFSILKEFINARGWKSDDDILNYYNGDTYQYRVLGFLSERIETIYFCTLILNDLNIYFSDFIEKVNN